MSAPEATAPDAQQQRPKPPVVEDLGAGVHSIAVPIPDNPLGHTFVYVLESERGPVLVDSGWDDPRSFDVLTDGLRAIGTSVEDVHGVLVTHNHPDHHGLSARLELESGCWLAMHEADIKGVVAFNTSPREKWIAHHTAQLIAAGAPDSALAAMDVMRATPKRDRMVLAEPQRELVHGDLAPVAGRRVRIVWTPGHTPGHVCLHLEEGESDGRAAGRLLSGDHVLPGITPHIGLYDGEDDGSDPLGDYLDSLARVAALPVTGVLPAHQYRIDDVSARVDGIVAHHEERLTALHDRLSAGELTLWEIAVGMEWNRPWEQLAAQNRLIALSEAAAHVRHLVKRGRAEILTVGHGDVPRYVAA